MVQKLPAREGDCPSCKLFGLPCCCAIFVTNYWMLLVGDLPLSSEKSLGCSAQKSAPRFCMKACSNALQFDGWGISPVGDSMVPHKRQATIFCIWLFWFRTYAGLELPSFFTWSSCHSLRKFLTACDMGIRDVISKHTLDLTVILRIPAIFILNGEDKYWKPITLWHLSTADIFVTSLV